MRKFVVAVIALLVSPVVFCQNTIRLEIKSLPEYHASGSSIYAAGSFNGWNPQDDKYKFNRDEKGNYFLEISLAAGKYEYKLTRGGWDKVEVKTGGGNIENRSLTFPSANKIELQVAEWADRLPAKPRQSTASKNVSVVDTAFLIPQLKRTRRVLIYLPENYSAQAGTRYPVLYMHDGQNVFDDASSFAGEWGVDEFMDSAKRKSCIIVAIDHGNEKRTAEYNPYDHSRYGKGEGKLYADFLAKTLKPFIDDHYRTKKDKEHTFITGSSMGGLISFYTALKYPDVFGGAGVFSPSFWIAPSIYADIKSLGKKVKGSIYLYAGKQEGEGMVEDMLKVMEALSAVSKAKIKTVIRDEGKHNEATWRKEFPGFYEWMIK